MHVADPDRLAQLQLLPAGRVRGTAALRRHRLAVVGLRQRLRRPEPLAQGGARPWRRRYPTPAPTYPYPYPYPYPCPHPYAYPYPIQRGAASSRRSRTTRCRPACCATWRGSIRWAASRPSSSGSTARPGSASAPCARCSDRSSRCAAHLRSYGPSPEARGDRLGRSRRDIGWSPQARAERPRAGRASLRHHGAARRGARPPASRPRPLSLCVRCSATGATL